MFCRGVGPAAKIMPRAEVKDLGDGRIEVMPKSTELYPGGGL